VAQKIGLISYFSSARKISTPIGEINSYIKKISPHATFLHLSHGNI
jgi:hypothetical protein